MNKQQKRRKNKNKANSQATDDAEDVQISSEPTESVSENLSVDSLNAVKTREARKSLSLSSVEQDSIKKQLITQYSHLEKTNVEKDKQIAVVAEIGKTLLEKNQYAEQQIQQLKETENEKDEKITKLTLQVAELEEKLKKYESLETSIVSKKVFEQEVKEMEAKYVSLHEEHLKLQEEHNKLEKNSKKREKQLSDELNDIRQTSSELSEQVSKLKEQLRTSTEKEQETSELLQQKTLELEELYKVQKETGSVSDKKYEDMQLKLAKKKEEIANLQEQLQKLQEQLQSLTNLENESNILASRNEELVKENRELSSYLNEARETINELKTFIAEEPNFIQTANDSSLHKELELSLQNEKEKRHSRVILTISRTNSVEHLRTSENTRESNPIESKRQEILTQPSQQELIPPEASNFIDDCILHDTVDTRVTASNAINRVRNATSYSYNRLENIWAVGRYVVRVKGLNKRVVRTFGSAYNWTSNRLMKFSVVRHTVHAWVLLVLITILFSMYTRTWMKAVTFRPALPFRGVKKLGN